MIGVAATKTTTAENETSTATIARMNMPTESHVYSKAQHPIMTHPPTSSGTDDETGKEAIESESQAALAAPAETAEPTCLAGFKRPMDRWIII